jgi:tripartite-type tricarboxylate transporter receptor subunit TctC
MGGMLRLWLLFTLALFQLHSAKAEDAYPSRPVYLIVPAAPGGSFDILGRIIAHGLSERWHSNVIVENRAGGGGNIGALTVSKAEPDGYTLLVWNDSLLINPTLLPKTSLDPKNDFTPISLSIYVPNVLVAHPSTGFLTFADFLSAARAKPGQMNYGSPGNGSPGHLSFELLKQLAKIDVVHVPYRGAGPAISDLLAGHIQLGMVAVPGAIGYIRAGTLIPLGVTSARPVAALPNVPPIAQAGLPAYKINAWHGILGPAKMPRDLVKRLERDITDVIKEPAVSQQLIQLGFEPAAGSASELAAIIDRDLPIWHDLVIKSGAQTN